jgi:hypothetical protein
MYYSFRDLSFVLKIFPAKKLEDVLISTFTQSELSSSYPWLKISRAVYPKMCSKHVSPRNVLFKRGGEDYCTPNLPVNTYSHIYILTFWEFL